MNPLNIDNYLQRFDFTILFFKVPSITKTLQFCTNCIPKNTYFPFTHTKLKLVEFDELENINFLLQNKNNLSYMTSVLKSISSVEIIH